MTQTNKQPVTVQELLVTTLAQTDALAKLLIEKGMITREEYMEKISAERATYQKLLNPTVQ
jgi:type IV secretory pathway component VirB8